MIDHKTAAALAAILDPERKVPGWWSDGYSFIDAPPSPTDFYFTGPPDLHTAREHCWRMEEWLKSRDCRILSSINMTYVDCMFDENIDYENISENDNHAAALRAAVERISNG